MTPTSPPASPDSGPAAASPQPLRPANRRLVLVSAILLLAIGLAEVLLRLFWVAPTQEARSSMGSRPFLEWLSEQSMGKDRSSELYQADAERMWVLRPGVELDCTNPWRTRSSERQPVHIAINGEGYRGRPMSARRADSRELRVICLGDSNIFGHCLDDEHTFPRGLERALAAVSTDVKPTVVNAGTPGYTVVQGSRWFRQVFDQHDCDWLLLSFLNNDAWLQPASDRTLLGRRASWVGGIVQLGASSQLVCWARSQLASMRTEVKNTVPRVPLEEYLEGYRELIAAARERRTRVMILDHRAHREYQPYSQALQKLALDERVEYVDVNAMVGPLVDRGEPTDSDPALVERVRQRWGAENLGTTPHLWYYTELKPEHLDEVGADWLARQLAPRLAKR